MDASQLSIRRIEVAGHTIALMGLDEALAQAAAALKDAPEEEILAELLARVSLKNYIAPTLREAFGKVLLEEFRKFLREGAGPGAVRPLRIEVLGQGCAQCRQWVEDIHRLLAEMQIPAEVRAVHDLASIGAADLSGTPALVVDGRVWCVGRWPGKEPLRKRLLEACRVKSSRRRFAWCLANGIRPPGGGSERCWRWSRRRFCPTPPSATSATCRCKGWSP
jgi:hypothetical protein